MQGVDAGSEQDPCLQQLQRPLEVKQVDRGVRRQIPDSESDSRFTRQRARSRSCSHDSVPLTVATRAGVRGGADDCIGCRHRYSVISADVAGNYSLTQ